MRPLKTALTAHQGVRALGGELGDHWGHSARTRGNSPPTLQRSSVRNLGARGNLATLEGKERRICLKPMKQEIQGINSLAALNHPHLRNEHRDSCLGETKMTGAKEA